MILIAVPLIDDSERLSNWSIHRFRIMSVVWLVTIPTYSDFPYLSMRMLESRYQLGCSLKAVSCMWRDSRPQEQERTESLNRIPEQPSHLSERTVMKEHLSEFAFQVRVCILYKFPTNDSIMYDSQKNLSLNSTSDISRLFPLLERRT